MTGTELQVTVGDASAGCLIGTRLFNRSDVVAHRDRLSCGPLTSPVPLEAWRRLRDAYWDEVLPLPHADSTTEPLPGPPDLVCLADRPEILLSAEVVNVWLGVSLDDQLFLAWLLELGTLVGLDPERIRVIQFERQPETGEAVLEVGELEPSIAADHPAPSPLSSAAIADLRAAWSAISAPEPVSLLRYIEQHAASQTIFHRAFARILCRFPHCDNGLNGWENELLRRVPRSGISRGALLAATIDECGEELDRAGGIYLSDRLRRLANPEIPAPLLILDGPPDSHSACTVSITAAGGDVLDHKANFVKMNGIDDWVGGVHLQSARNKVWFRVDHSLVSAAQPTP